MGTILIENMEFYAFHGCFKEENIIGNRFIVNISIETDTIQAEISDKISDALNYQDVYNLISEEMNKKSNLLENVARRTLNLIMQTYPQIKKINLKVSKCNPPIGGRVEMVSVSLSESKE